MNDMGNSLNTSGIIKQKADHQRNGWKWAFFILIMIVLVAATVVAITGLVRIEGIVGNKHTPSVCTNDIVNRFNEVTELKEDTVDGIITGSIDTDGLRSLEEEIKDMPGAGQDPTCQALLFLAAVRHNNYENAQKAGDQVQKLYDQGLYANTNIRSNPPLFLYGGWIDSLKQNQAAVESGEPEDRGQ